MSGARQYCITCKRSDWWAMQALAKDAEMKTSPFIVREVLGEDCRLALTADEQRDLHDRTVRLASLSEGLLRDLLPGSDVTLSEALAFLWRDLQARQRERGAGISGNAGPLRPGSGARAGPAGPVRGGSAMKAPEDRSVPHSISCKPVQWMRMQELADRAGKPVSRFIVGRVLKRDGFSDGKHGHALALDEAQQREMQGAAVGAEAALSELLGSAGGTTPGLAAMVACGFLRI